MKMKKYALGILACLGVMCICACGPKANKYDDGTYADDILMTKFFE